jgi:NADH dehydrogenase FAD-containing subunit
MSSFTKKNIVIVGGGAGGATTARLLSSKLDSKKYSVTVINPLPYLIIRPASARAAVANVDNLSQKIFIPLDKIFRNTAVNFVQGKVASIGNNAEKGGAVVLESGERISFAVLVLSPGSTWAGPIAFPEEETNVKKFINKGHADFEKAQSIVVAGGGAVGIELSAEIKDIWPRKNVTLVQGDSAVLNAAYPDKLRKRVQARLRAHGVEVVLNDYVDNLEIGTISYGKGVRTRYNKEINADLVVSARGPRPNTGFISASLGPSAVTSRGHVKVLPTLQLPEHPNIFAMGDIIDWTEQKQFMKVTGGHAPIVVNNVAAYLSGRALKRYKGSPEIISITIGKNGGVSYMGMLWGFTFGDWFTRMLKSRGLMIDMISKPLLQ